MRPTWYENGPRGGKEAEKKRTESREAQKVLSGASWERSGATSFDFEGAWVEFAATLDLQTELEFRRDWALKVSKSAVK